MPLKGLNAHNRILIMPIGLPACGKSTLFSFLEQEYKGRILSVSLDDILEDVASERGISYADAYALQREDEEVKKDVNERYNALVERALSHDGIVFWDQTNLTRPMREKRLRQFEGFRTIGVVFDVDDIESKKRCAKRYKETGKYIADYVVDAMYKNFLKYYPSADEFDVLYRVSKDGQMIRAASYIADRPKTPKP